MGPLVLMSRVVRVMQDSYDELLHHASFHFMLEFLMLHVGIL